jgi:hypothetical protein
LQFSTNPTNLFASTKATLSSICGFNLDLATNCCGGSLVNPPKGHPKNALGTSGGTISCSRTYGTTAAGSYSNPLWTWFDPIIFDFSKNVTIKALISGVTGDQPCSLVVLDKNYAIKKSDDGNAPSVVTLSTKANYPYYIAVGYNDPAATITITYSQP